MGVCASSLRQAEVHDEVWRVNDVRVLARCLSARPGVVDRSLNKNGETLLHLAAIHGTASGSAALITLMGGADTEARDVLGRTALHHAALLGHKAVILALLECGSAAVDARDRSGSTPLLLAAYNGHAACIGVLLDRGASLAAADARGWAALHVAARGGQDSCVELLLWAGAPVDAAGAAGRTPLMLAAMGGHLASLKALLRGGADTAAVGTDGATALHCAAAAGQAACVVALLRAEADANAVDRQGRLPLHVAAERGHCACLAALAAASGRWACLEATDGSGRTAAQLAEDSGRAPMIALLQRLRTEWLRGGRQTVPRSKSAAAAAANRRSGSSGGTAGQWGKPSLRASQSACASARPGCASACKCIPRRVLVHAA